MLYYIHKAITAAFPNVDTEYGMTKTMTNTQKMALYVASALWMIWGLVHILAGVMIVSLSGVDMFTAIGGKVDPSELADSYHPLINAILNQHGWNLGFAGLWTAVASVFIWRGNMTAIWTTAAVGGLVDIGYFVFIDLGGFGVFLPGGLMTYVSATAIVLSGWVWVSNSLKTK